MAGSVTFGADSAAVDGVDADDTAPTEAFVRDADQAFAGEPGALLLFLSALSLLQFCLSLIP